MTGFAGRVRAAFIRTLGAAELARPVSVRYDASGLDRAVGGRSGVRQEQVISEKSRSIYIVDPGAKPVLGFESVLVKRILRLGLPVIIGMLTQTAINMIDAAMVGRLPEDEAVAGTAALGPSLILLWAFGGFLSAISVGTQALTARRIGEGNALAAGKVLTNSAVLALASSLVATVVAILLAGPIFSVISHDPNVREVGTTYIQARYVGLFSMVMMASYKSFYDGLGRVRVHMMIAIFMNAVNAIANWFLIFGHAGAPRLGVAGAAWGSVIASVAGLVVMVAWSMRKKDRRTFGVYRLKNLDLSVLASVTRLSVWSGLAILFAMMGFGLFFVIVGRVDEAEGLAGVNTAATTAVINISMIVFMTCIAFGTSTATLISQSLGAGQKDLAVRYGQQSVKLIVLAMTLIGIAAALFPEEILRVFLPAEAGADEQLKDRVIATAAASLSLCTLGAPIAATALVLAQALYGAGESRFVMIVEGTLHFLCLVPLAWFFAVYLELGLVGCWLAAGVYGLLLMTAVGWKFVGRKWTEIVI